MHVLALYGVDKLIEAKKADLQVRAVWYASGENCVVCGSRFFEAGFLLA
jgi:hypothetical protein